MSHGIDYLYLETRDLEASRAFWEALDFELELDLGHACRLRHPDGGAVHLEAVAEEDDLAVQLYLKGSRTVPNRVVAEHVARDWQESHWGSHLLELRDPDGRTVIVQDRD